MVITSTFTGSMLRQFLKDSEFDHLEIIGTDDNGIHDDETYMMDGIIGSNPAKVRVSIVHHIDNITDLRKEWKPIAELEDRQYSYPICYAAIYSNPLKPLEKEKAIIEFPDFKSHIFVDRIDMTEDEVKQRASEELKRLIIVYQLSNIPLPAARNLDDIEYFGIMKLQIEIPVEQINRKMEELDNENN
jgi:hypothetical protein